MLRRVLSTLAKNSGIFIALLSLLSGAPVAHAASSTLVISQFQVAGGSAADEFVELHNVSGSGIDLNGYRVVYRSAAGVSDVAIVNWTTSTIIPAGGYYLIAATPGYDGTTAANATFADGGSGRFAAAGGGLAIRNGALNTGAIIDSVSYGTATNAFVEGSVETAPAANASAIRASNGCTDTDNNASDFSTQNPSAPRNASTAASLCGTPDAAPTITPPADPITTVAQDAAPFTVNLGGSDDGGVYNWSATPGTGVQSVSVTGGQGTATVTYTVTLTAGYSGTATFTATLSDNVNTPVNQVVNITVTPAPPPAPTGLAATAGTSHVALTWNTASGATSYNVKRSTTSGTETTIASPGTNSYDDTTAVDGTPYFYVVSGVSAGGEGSDSAEVTATPMAAPTTLVATPGDNHVVLTWDAMPGATGYNVKRSTTTGTETTIATPGTNTYDDTTAVNGTQYFYVVSATNANGESIDSSEVNATPATPGRIVISQVYGGGGSAAAGTAYTKDYVELFNRGGLPVDISGYSLQYGSSGGNFGASASAIFVFPASTSIAAGKYLLIALGSPGTAGASVPSPDFTTTNLSMAAGSGKVALVNSGTALACGATASPCTLPDARILDSVAWGTSNNGEGGTTVNNGTALNSTNGGVRKQSGCQDTENNNNDFTVETTGTGLVPRNSATPANVCGAPPANNPPVITPPLDPITTVVQDAPPFTVGLTGSDDNNAFTWSATPGTGIQSVSVTGGQGTASVTYTVTLQAGYTGTATFTATLTDGVNPPVNQAVNITVNPPAAPGAPTGLTASAGDSHVQLDWNTVPGATSYNVKRSTTSGAETTIASPATNSYDDTTAVNGTPYFYVVSAVGPGGEGPDSSEVTATPAAVTPVPAGLKGVVSNNQVALSWNAVGGATSYNLKRSLNPGGPYATINSPASTSYTDTAVTNGTRYYYVVSAVAPVTGESADSAEVHAKPDFPEALGVVISQVYGAGGNSGATLTNDFIELFNRGNSVVDLSGWSVQYSSAAGSTWTATPLSGTIAPGQHYLIGEGAGTGGTTPLPALDATGGIAMSGTAGKVLLLSTAVAASGACPTGLVDEAGYGSSATCFEGSGPTPNPSSNANSLHRALNGCTDTNNNAGDFSNAAANPRNTASAPTPCTITAIAYVSPASVTSGGSTTIRVELPPPTTGGSVTGDLSTIGGSASEVFLDNGTSGDITANDNIFTLATTATGSAGVKSLPISASNASAQNTTTSALLTITPPLETIAAVKVDTTPADTAPDRLGQPVLVQGVVTSIDFRGGTGIEYYIQDATGGIDVFATGDFGPFTVGASVEVNGTITQFNGLTEITPTTMTPVAALPAVTPQVVTLSQLADGSGESLEGKLVRIDDLTVTSGTFPASGTSGNVTITDVTGSGTLRVDSDTDIDGTTAPGGVFSLIGLVGQSDSTNPFDCCYQVLPRSTADIIPRTAPSGIGTANPPSVPPGATTLLTVSVTLGQNPPSTGIGVVTDLSAIGLSAAQTFFDDGSNGDAAPGDSIYSYQATVPLATALGPKSLPFLITDAQTRSGSGSISLNIQSASAPPTPANLAATPGNAQVSLTWDTSLGATGYNVKRALVSGGPYTTIASDIATNSYTDTGRTNGVTYYYVVSALSGANESGDSLQASATPSAPPPSGPMVKVYFVDIGQGAGTLIVSPAGTSVLIDGGPTGQGTSKVIPLLNSVLPPGDKLEYTILTHYHVDHDAGLTEVINAGWLDNGVAYDNGDGPNVIPPVPSNSTGTAWTAYKNAIASRGNVTRTTVTPGQVLDLGGGLKATFLVAGGALASGGNVWVSGTDLNSSSVSTLLQFNDFDLLISGDMTGGGQTTTAKTPDVETFVAQMAGDIDFVQLDHHGSTTANQRRFLSQLKAEGSLASIGASNTFGHPNRETVNKYLNIPVTSGNTYGGEGIPNPGNGPVYYQTDPSPAADTRTSVQGYSGADQAHAGLGTILLETDGLVSFTMESFDDGGVRISPSAHVYALDGQGLGVATDFAPTVIPSITPGVPTAADTVTVTALVNDVQPITSVTLDYALNGAAQAPVTMSPTVGSEYAGTIPAQPDGTRVDYTVTAIANGLTTSYRGGYFAGTTPIANLRTLTPLGEPLYLDYAARISGTATSTTGNYSSTNNDDYIVDGTGALNVSRTIEPTSPATQPMTAGTTYTVAGFINQLTGRFRLDVTPPFDGIDKPWASAPGVYNPYSITSTGSAAVTPLTRTIAQINADGEGNEAQLVTIANCTVVSGTIPSSGGVDGFLVVSDGTGTIEMKIDGDSDIPGLATPAGTFTLVGIVQQDDFLRPFDTRYTVAPRDRTDLGAAAGGPALITIAEARADIDPTTSTTPDDFVPDLLGQQVKVRGVVTSVDFRGASGTEIYIQDPTGGVDIFSSSINTTFNIGDNLEVVGVVSQFNGLTEIAPASASDITVLAPGTLPTPGVEVVTLSQLANGGVGEAYEGKLLRINNVTLASPPATFAANTNYTITDATGSVLMRIDADTDIDGTAPPAGTFSVIGVLGQFDNASVYDSGYQLFPRIRATDFLPSVPAAASISATAGTPQSAAVGSAFAMQLQATVLDSGSAPIEGAGVTFTAPASGASGTFANGTTTTSVATDASGIATATVFTANGVAGAYDVTATTAALSATFALTNTDPSATHFDITAPANVTNGIAFNVTVTARDASNAVAAAYLGTVHFTSSSAGTLPSDYTFVAGDAGAHTFSVTLTTEGSQSITATDTVSASITGTANITVDPCTLPTTPTITATTNGTGTQDQACPEQPLTLNANATGATSYQWYKDVDLLNGETNTTYQATGAASYYVTATNACGTTVQSAAYVVQNPTPHNPVITAGGTLICTGGSVELTSDSATGIQWYKDNVAIPGANSQTYIASATGSYTAILNALGCHSGVSNAIVLTSGAGTAPDATITTPSVIVGHSVGSASVADAGAGASYSWSVTASQILSGAGTNSITFSPNVSSGTIRVQVTVTVPGGCTDTKFVDVTVQAPQPATHFSVSAPATATAGSPFNVTVTALDASDNIASQYNGTVHFTSTSAGTLPSDYTFIAGDHGAHTFTVTLTTTGAQSVTATDTVTASITGTANTNVSAAPQVATHYSVTAPASVTTGVPFNVTVTALDASNATVTGYTGTVHFTSSSAGTLPADYTFVAGDNGTKTFSATLTTIGAQSVTATDTVTASITGTANTNVSALPPAVTVTLVSPANGSSLGGTPVTISGSGFNSGASVTFGGTAATNVVVVNAGQITATTPAHAAGAVNVTVTNTDTTTGTLTNGFTYVQQNFDANGDSVIDPADIFYLVNYLFLGGPAPAGVSGPVLSGDANGDGVVDPADIFYLVNYLFGGGPAPHATGPGRATTTSMSEPFTGAIRLGDAVRRDGHWFVPVIVTMDPESSTPQALSLRIRYRGEVTDSVVHRGDGLAPIFETSQKTADSVSYLVAFSDSAPILFDQSRSAVLAEIEVTASASLRLDIDPELTMLVTGSGTRKATVANHALRILGTSIDRMNPSPRLPKSNEQK